MVVERKENDKQIEEVRVEADQVEAKVDAATLRVLNTHIAF